MNRKEVAKALDALGVTVTLADDPVDGSRIEVVHLDDLARIGAVFEQARIPTTPTDDEREALVPEPREREAIIHGDLVTMRVKEWARITDELARLRTLEGSLDETQGEPTDAAVLEAVSAERKAIASLLMSLGDRMTGEGTQAGYYAAAHEVRERERAALRAAAEAEGGNR